jgi:hypothetical protein
MLRPDVPVVEAPRLVLRERKNALGAVVEVIERCVSGEAVRARIDPRRACLPAAAVAGRSAHGLPLTQPPFDRTDESSADCSANDTRDQRDNRDRA